MTEMIRTTSGEYVHPLDYVRGRRWSAPHPADRSARPAGPASG